MNENTQNSILSTRLQNLVPYTPGEQPQDKRYIKLNTNENPYPPTPKIKEFLNNYDSENLRLYPDPAAVSLREKFAEYYKVKLENVFVGNGSDEVLSLSFFAFFDNSRGKILFPNHTYSFYPVYCNFYSINYEPIVLEKDFSINIDKYINVSSSCGIIFPNPNAPTGIFLDFKYIQRLLSRYPKNRIIIIDEAYIEFGGRSASDFLSEHDNLLIVGTFSKNRALAGLRLGYALGSEVLIKALFTAKDSFNSYPVNRLTQKIGEIAIENNEYYKRINKKIIETRDKTIDSLSGLGWNVLPSKANFVFAKKAGTPGKKIYECLKENNILVRYFDIDGIKDYVRITIGAEKDMDIFTGKVKELF